MTTLFDGRDIDALEARLRVLARTEQVPGLGGRTWWQLLYDPEPGPLGEPAPDPRSPDRALLRVLAELQSGLGAHLDALPDRLRGQWLRDVLGIPPATAVPDVVPAVFAPDPARLPVVVPAQTEVRAKDGGGRARRYRTTAPLTVHGTAVSAVRAYRAVRDADGAVRDTAVEWADQTAAFAPFAAAPTDATPRAPHRCRFASPQLALSGRGSLQQVTVTFAGLAPALLDGVRWLHSTAEGPREVTSAVRTSTAVELTVAGACAPDPASGETLPWIEAVLPTEAATLDDDALSAVFSDVTLTVRVEDLPADGAYAGDAKLDTEKEFHPFGPVPRRGEVFQVVSDEAFAKPLGRLGVRLVAAPRPQAIFDLDITLVLDSLEVRGTSSAWIQLVSMQPHVSWQRRVADRWREFHDGGSWPVSRAEDAVPNAGAAEPFTEPSLQGGKLGRALRLVLSGGDLGWEAYQAQLAQFAADVANGDRTVSASDLTPPDPPALVGVTITYQTVAVRPERVYATDGWAVRMWDTGSFPVFAVPVDIGPEVADAATLDLGLALPDTALGSTVSLYLDVESADVGALRGASTWSVRTPGGWLEAAVDDGTRGLRQSGLLHVVAPAEWQWGSPESGDLAGVARWLRLTSTEPGRLGALLAVVPDVAEAAQEGRPALVEPEVALAPGEVKGLVGSIAGIKKVTNLPGRRGRSAEGPRDTGYLRRGSGYHRHRDRAVQAWDYEELARLEVPDLAAVRCLPHTCAVGGTRPGSVALVVVPAGTEPMPVPTVAMAERIETALRRRMPVTATLAVLSPAYHPVSVTADVVLAPRVPALVGKQAVLERLEAWLHPAKARPVRFGRPLFTSQVVAFLESIDVVDRVSSFALFDASGPAPDPIVPEQAWGLVASSGSHTITVRELL
jgi:hypothetical protein